MIDDLPAACREAHESMQSYGEGKLAPGASIRFEAHIAQCDDCREKFESQSHVISLLTEAYAPLRISTTFVQETRSRLRTMEEKPAVLKKPDAEEDETTRVAKHAFFREYDESRKSAAVDAGSAALAIGRLGDTPWWLVSFSLHVLMIALASLVTMSIELPHNNDDTTLMTTEFQARAPVAQETEKPKLELRDTLSSPHDTPPTDLNSKDASEIVVPADILARAELGDHFETINPDLVDNHSARGNEETQSFHSAGFGETKSPVEGNTDAAGGGGMSGVGMEELVGVGGAASKGSGNGWGGGAGTGVGVQSGAGRGSFGQRGGSGRKLLVKRHGGSKASENAVDLALQWLAYHQEADGHWNSKKYGGGHDSEMNDVSVCDTAMTALSTLAFLGAGHTEKVGAYKDNVQRAVAWLISKQKPDGLVLDEPREGRVCGYSAAMASLALAEAAGMGNVKETREAAQKAINYCTEIHQNGAGSEKRAWRYEAKDPNQDISVSGWFIMAMKSAKVAGLHVNPASFDAAIQFIEQLQIKNVAAGDAGYGPASEYRYKTNCGPSPRRDAIGNLARQFLGWKKEDLESSVDYFVKQGGTPRWEKPDFYYWYYGTLCVFQQGGEVWKKWNEDMKKALIENQCKHGDDAGSWPVLGEYSEDWGRVGQTALGALSLEVYYRYLQVNPEK